MVEVKLLFFAKSRELAGNISSTRIQVPASITCADLLTLICDTFNLGLIRDNIILAVNEQYCYDPNQVLNFTTAGNDEIAVIPPLSGG